MILSIPSHSTINEYKQLKSSQKEININSTSKKLDEYVYDRAHKFNNAKIFGVLALLDIAFAIVSRKTKGLQDCLFMLGITNFAGLGIAFDNNTNKKYILKNPNEKLKLYKQNGINAVV